VASFKQPSREYSAPRERGDLLQFIVEQSCERAVVYDATQSVVFKNGKAKLFLESHPLPDEIPTLAKKIFTAIAHGRTAELFPGQICFRKEIGGRHWRFRVSYREGDQPLVAVFFTDETVSSRFDLNVLRQQYRLTRRETDVLRHLLDGQRNHEIAQSLAITEQTVKDYLSCIYYKVGAPDRFALLRYLICSSQE
jgi:DNA-binding CsgD family transcriptional regulator